MDGGIPDDAKRDRGVPDDGIPDGAERGRGVPDGGVPEHPPATGRPPVIERRLHPVTPFRRAWAPLAVLAGWAVHDLNGAQEQLTRLTGTVLLLALAVLVPAAGLYGFLSWWFTHYAVTDTELRIRTGLLFRRTAHIRLERIQAVDVSRPLLARVAGVAKLRLDVVGTDDKDELAFLGEREARALRAELLARAAGFAPETAHEVGEAPARTLLRVPPRELVRSVLLTGATWGSLCAALVVPTVLWLVTHNPWTVLATALPPVRRGRREQCGPVRHRVRLDGERVPGRAAHRPRAARPCARDGAARPGADRADRGAAAVAGARLGARRARCGRIRQLRAGARRPARGRGGGRRARAARCGGAPGAVAGAAPGPVVRTGVVARAPAGGHRHGVRRPERPASAAGSRSSRTPRCRAYGSPRGPGSVAGGSPRCTWTPGPTRP